jgi:hypothetical protein
VRLVSERGERLCGAAADWNGRMRFRVRDGEELRKGAGLYMVGLVGCQFLGCGHHFGLLGEGMRLGGTGPLPGLPYLAARAVLAHGLGVWPRHGLLFGPGQPRPVDYRAVPGLGQAKIAGFVPGSRARASCPTLEPSGLASATWLAQEEPPLAKILER